jgi:hypothetical protein
MTCSNNPFVRGYEGLSVQRLLAINCTDDHPMIHLPLHASQSYLPDDAIERRVCLYWKNFALIDEDQEVPFDLRMQLQGEGYVCAVVYAVTATESDRSLRVGDTCSEEAAHEVVRRLRFETGVYSRCWEISSAHLSVQAHRFLAELADVATPSGFLFVAFRIPHSRAIGVKLIGTPWADSNLRSVHGITAERLRQKQRGKDMPEPLVEVLHLAALANARILIFDPEAPVLAGLTLYNDQ